tara:strand:+ start:13015 stop:13617 length:603 start_codon:yes stop_codon:yes gene_type:complete
MAKSENTVSNNHEGNITSSDRIEFDTATNTASFLIQSHKPSDKRIGLYIYTAISTGLRISDLMRLTHEDMIKGFYEFREKKTSKSKRFPFPSSLISVYNRFADKGTGLLFAGSNGKAFSNSYINKRLKFLFENNETHVSSHSLRKTFGYRMYEKTENKSEALYKLSEIFNHSNTGVTKIYIGLRAEELSNSIEEVIKFDI